MIKPELLAPVGHMEALKAAVFAGADGVYLGGKEFNARINAANFSRDELVEAVEYCHIFGVHVYITINILVKDKEIKQVLEYIHFLYKSGVDALIIQDTGLFYLIKKVFPDLPLHSSTQMFIHGLHGVKLLEELGFERIVLARELTAKEIKHIVDNTQAEIKIFNHGAMCVCYSGQCLMSSMIGGRSGNRGSCAQPCRKPYELWQGGKLVDTGHVLSPKDLNSLDIISNLIETGAHSFKIEGRKKSAQYVFTVVSAYRKLIDAYCQGNELNLTEKENLDIEQVFNRKFTQGYFPQEKLTQDEFIAKDNPKKRGVLLGEVSAVKNNCAVVKLENHVTIGDGLLILGDRTEFGEVLNSITDELGNDIECGSIGQKVCFSLKKKVAKGDKLYKTSDSELATNLKTLLKTEYPRKLPVFVEVVLKINEPLVAKVVYEDIVIEFQSKRIVEEAINKPIDKARIKEQFSKLGNTPFALTEISINMDENSIVPISEINEARRVMISELTQRITKVVRPSIEVKSIDEALHISTHINQFDQSKLVVKTSRIELLPEIAKSKVDEIIFGGDIEFKLCEYIKAVELCQKHGKDIRLAFPSVTRYAYIQNLIKNIDKIQELKPKGILLSNYELISLFKETELPLEADYKFNAFNRYSLLKLQELGFSSAYLALELNQSEIGTIAKNSQMELGLYVHGNTELMVSEYSLFNEPRQFGYLKDKLGYEFPVKTDDQNRTHVYNGKKLSLYDELNHIKNINKYRIDITDEDVDEILYTIEGYKEKLKGNSKVYDKLTASNPEITKGHYKRGV